MSVLVSIGQYRHRLAGEADECDWHGWDLPEGVEVAFADCPECDAELATELLEMLGQQVYDGFACLPFARPFFACLPMEAPKPEPSLEKIT